MTGTNTTRSALPLLLALGLGWPCNPLSAQEVPAGSPNDMPMLRNGIAPHLKPTARRPAAKPTEAYKPIEKQDDAGQVPEIELFAGESRVFPTPGVARIAVGNGGIMTAAVLDDKETIIFGNAPGTTSLFIWNADGRYQRLKVNVVPGDTSRVAREIAAFLTAIPNTKASIVGDKVIVEGDELTDADRAKIAELGKRYPQIVNFTSQVGWEKMVLMDVKVVEFPKTEMRELGLKWNPTGGAAIGAIWSPVRRGDVRGNINLQQQGLPAPIQPFDGETTVPLPSALGVRSVVNLGLNAQLNALEQNGRASILAEPQLSARSGAKASFLAGGEIPYAVTSLMGTTVQFKQYGIKLDIEPRVGLNGVIRATIAAEVSDIDPSYSTSGGGPALLSRKTNTEFNVRNGETLVLAGLLQRNVSHDVDKVPFLGDIPVLGALFRSKRYQNKETELVVFVTPTIVDSQTPGLVERLEKTGERLGEQLGKSPYLSEPLQPGSDAGHPAGATSAPAAPAHPPAPPQADAGNNALRVTKDGLVIRAAPDARSQALFELGYNSVVRPGAAPDRNVGGTVWRNVRSGDIDGWVTADQVEPLGLRAVSADAHSALARRDQTGKPLTLGAAVPGVAPGAATAVTATAAAPAAGTRYRVILDNLALYVSPDTNALVVKKLAEGSAVEALPQAPRGNWVAVAAGDARGWVASQWLRPLTETR